MSIVVNPVQAAFAQDRSDEQIADQHRSIQLPADKTGQQSRRQNNQQVVNKCWLHVRSISNPFAVPSTASTADELYHYPALAIVHSEWIFDMIGKSLSDNLFCLWNAS